MTENTFVVQVTQFDGRSKRLFYAKIFYVYFCHFRIKSNFEFAKLGRFHFFVTFYDFFYYLPILTNLSAK